MSQHPAASGTAVTPWNPSSLPMESKSAVVSYRPGGYPAEDAPDATAFDLVRVLRIFFKHRWVIAGCVLAALVLGLIITLTTTPLYRANVTIETAGATVQVTSDQSLQQDGGSQTIQDPREIATYVELLSSRSLAERVVNKLGLADDQKFLGTGGSQTLISRISRLLFSRGSADPESLAADLGKRQAAAITKILNNTAATAVRSSRLLTVSYSDPDSETAQRVADALASEFIRANLDRRFEATAYARHFLEDQIQQIKLKLEESERKVVDYADSQKLVNLDNKQSLLSSSIADLNTALAAASVARANAEELWLKVKDTTDYAVLSVQDQSASTAQSPIERLRGTKSDLVAQYQDKLNTFKPGFPEMVALRARIASIDKQVDAEIRNVKNTIRAKYELSVQRETALSLDLDKSRQALIDERNRGVEYTLLQREADTNRTLYDGLLQRYKEISVVGGVAASSLSIVDNADLPSAPYSPRKPLNMAIALLAGLMLGFGAAMTLEYFDNTIKSPDQMESLLGIPVLGLIPVQPKGESIETALDDPHSGISEAYRSVRTALQFSTDQGVPKNFVVTSARPAEGKTTTTLVLGRMFAQIGVRVLLIDADLRNPSMHKVIGSENVSGLSNYLSGGATPQDILRDTEIPNMAFIPSGPIPPNPAELLSSAKLLSLMIELREQFDLIILDSAPVMGLADALLLSSIADGTLMICAAGQTSIEAVTAATRRVQAANGQILGGVLTKFNAEKAGYGYAYYGYDYYGYGKEQRKQLTEA